MQLILRAYFDPARDTDTVLPLPAADLLPDPHPTKAPNELRVVLVRARGLIPRDSSGVFAKATTSDPRCVLKLSKGSDETFTSATRWKSLNPGGLERFGFLCDDTAEGVLRNECCLEVTVEDVDEMSGNDFMGLAKVPIAPLADHEPSRAWHKLLSSKGAPDKERGELELFARWLYNPLKDESLPLPEEDESCFETPEQMAAFKPNELIVVLVRARGLLAMDGPGHLAHAQGRGRRRGLSDPFVRFELLGARGGDTTTPGKSKEKHRSKVIRAWCGRAGSRPAFGLTHAGAVLRARVYDRDDASSPDFMGRCDVRCGGFNDRRSHRSWFRLTDDSKEGRFDKQRGELEIVTRWHYNPERVTDGHIPVPEDELVEEHPTKPPNELVVVVVRARNLPAMDGPGFGARLGGRQEEGRRERRRRRPRGPSDPVVTLKIVGLEAGGKPQKTSIVRKNTNPVFKESFSFEVDQEMYADGAAAQDRRRRLRRPLGQRLHGRGRRAARPLRRPQGAPPVRQVPAEGRRGRRRARRPT